MSAAAWHRLNTLREDVRGGTLTLAEFAADLNAVRTGAAPPVYREPAEFFARTYPTYNMKSLVRDVLQRLSGEGGKPIIRIQVAYGGGKTHTLITLLHLAERGAEMERNATVREFLDFAGLPVAPRARVALLPFDKFDVREGLVVYGPNGETRRVMTPWGALAYQLAGDAGFARVAEHERDYVAPAEPILVDLLAAPHAKGLASLILIDEAVWYYRGAVNDDPRRLGLLKDFFQVLIQAVGKVGNAALVAALIASATEANDLTGTQCMRALEDVFARMEEVTEPVARDDVAEVLRRRLFTAMAGEARRRPVVDALMACMGRLPLREAQTDQHAYNRFLAAYPFHPDLIAVLYGKWTQLAGFQRTRGALRLLAQALREADGIDPSPLVGPAALLARDTALSAAVNELIKVCEEREVWTPILASELEKAREVQGGFPSLQRREVERAVLATFLHSQPPGQHADPAELYGLLAHPDLDPTAMAEALKKWRDLSWFLVEDPDVWGLGTNPNLTHMHVRAMERLSEGQIDDELRARIQGARELTQADDGVQVHRLPSGPRDVGDSIDLHYVVLGPECAVEPGRPAPRQVEEYFTTTSGPHNPRIYRNSVIALAPDAARLAGLRERVRRALGWRAVETGDEQKLLSDVQRRELARRKEEAQTGLPEAVRATYSVVLAVDEEGTVEAKALPSGLDAPFERIKALLVENERLLVATLDPELLLPDSYFALWGPHDTSRRVRDLISAFAQLPRLPRLIRPSALLETLARGVREGQIVLRLPRPDGSAQTWWRIEPDAETLARAEMEVLPAHTAELSSLAPGRVDGLWPAGEARRSLADLCAFFDGQRAPRLAGAAVLMDAVRAAVARGLVMARRGEASYLRENLPDAVPMDDLLLLQPPPAPQGSELAPATLPEAWHDDTTTAADLWTSISDRRGYRLPWALFRDALSEALGSGALELAPGTAPWPAGAADAGAIHLRTAGAPGPAIYGSGLDPVALVDARMQATWASGTPTLRTIKEALEAAHEQEIGDEAFRQMARSALDRGIIAVAGGANDAVTLDTHVRRPDVALFTEAQLSPRELQDFAGIVQDLIRAAPELSLAFRLSVSAEGARPASDTIAALNALLARASRKLQLE